MTSADTLRAAADLIENRGLLASGARWTAAHESVIDEPSGWRIISIGDRDFADQNDINWIAGLGPQVGAPLSALLRSLSWQVEQEETEAAVVQLTSWQQAALHLAKLIVGEQP